MCVLEKVNRAWPVPSWICSKSWQQLELSSALYILCGALFLCLVMLGLFPPSIELLDIQAPSSVSAPLTIKRR